MQSYAKKISSNSLFGQVLIVSLSFAAAFLFSRTVVLRLCPIGSAFIAAVPSFAVLPSLVGSAVGTVSIIGEISAAKYLLSALFTAVLRLVFNLIDPKREWVKYLSCFVSLTLASLIVEMYGGFSAVTFLFSVFEATAAAALSYFFSISLSLVSNFLSLNCLDVRQISAVLVSVSVALMALSDITVFSVSIARILAVSAVLSAAVFGKEAAGGISGVVFGASMALCRPEMLFLCGGYSLGGLMAGVFSHLGSFAAAAIFAMTNGVFSLLSQTKDAAILSLYEVLFASVLFFLLPKGIKRRLSSFFMPKVSLIDHSLPQKLLSVRVKKAAKALDEVSDTVSKVGQVLGGKQEVHSLMRLQFEAVSGMLRSITDRIDSAESFDTDTAQTVEAVLKSLSLHPKQVCCVGEKNGVLRITATLSDGVIPQKKIAETLSVQIDRPLVCTRVERVGEETEISLCDTARFSVDFAVKQYINSKYTVSGDAFCNFFDENGDFVMIISDGMGSGSRAAVDGSLTVGLMSRLLKAGFDSSSALGLVNSSLLYKSGDESLSTLDISSFDLKTGEVRFFKAGTPPTYIRREKMVGTAGCSALPIGILSDVSFDESRCTLKRGDIVVMVSDGATDGGDDWIKGEIKQFEGSAGELADSLVKTAVSRFQGHEDDITVLVAILK